MNEELDRRFEEVNRRMDQGFEEVHRGMEELRQETRELRQETKELRRGVRKNGVMIEKLDGDIRLVAEGVVTNRQIMEGFIEESRREREEDRRLWRRLFGGHEQRFQQVEGRVDGLEVRVGALESHDR